MSLLTELVSFGAFYYKDVAPNGAGATALCAVNLFSGKPIETFWPRRSPPERLWLFFHGPLFGSIPTGLHHSAQGWREAPTLG